MDNDVAHTVAIMLIGGAFITWFLMGIIPALLGY